MEDEVAEEIVKKLDQIRIMIQIQNRDVLAREIRRVVSTTDRRKMWSLCNGRNSSVEISKKSGMSHRAVQYFLADAKSAGIVETLPNGASKRSFDVEVDWEAKDG